LNIELVTESSDKETLDCKVIVRRYKFVLFSTLLWFDELIPTTSFKSGDHRLPRIFLLLVAFLIDKLFCYYQKAKNMPSELAVDQRSPGGKIIPLLEYY
jgi:hypothetical protein